MFAVTECNEQQICAIQGFVGTYGTNLLSF